jgi:GNAT superfamily N-acetyltransferase
VRALAFSPGGESLLSGSEDHTARLARADGSGEQHLEHQDTVRAVAFSADGRFLLTGSHDQTARLWEARTGRVVGVLRGHGAAVKRVTFSPDGRLVATAAIVPHGDRFGWISMVLVAEAWRRRGLARWMLDRCIATLRTDGRVPVLDATPDGREVYRRLGFDDGPVIERFESIESPSARVETDSSIRRLDIGDLDAISALDTPAFGADRKPILAHLANRLPDAAHVAWRGGRLTGFVLARDGSRATQIGPLVAVDAPTAIALFDAARRAVTAPMFIDTLPQPPFRAHIAASGFTLQRKLTCMALGGSVPGDERLLFAAAGPELG